MTDNSFKTIIEKNLARKEGVLKYVQKYEPTPRQVEEVLEFLGSEASLESLRLDPYWPKWNTPWWMMALLWEMGLAHRLSLNFCTTMSKILDKHYLHLFPLRQEEISPGVDPYRGLICHCALGIMYQILLSSGIEIDYALPWISNWFLVYQLSDGGFNCDESVYLKAVPHSSFLSTLPPLEAMLLHYKSKKDDKVLSSLNRGADYLLKRRLCRCLSKNFSIINEAWLSPVFPRFYNYDILRGLSFVVEWSAVTKTPLQITSVEEAISVIDSSLDPAGVLSTKKNNLIETEVTLFLDENKEWKKWKPARSFPLLESVSRSDAPSPYLTLEWYNTVEILNNLVRERLIV